MRPRNRLPFSLTTLCAIALGVAALAWAFVQVFSAPPRFTSPANAPRPWAADYWERGMRCELPPDPPLTPPAQSTTHTITADYGVPGAASLRVRFPTASSSQEFGPRAEATDHPYTWRSGSVQWHLAALAVYINPRFEADAIRPPLGFFRPDGASVTSATLRAEGVPAKLLNASIKFAPLEHLRMHMLWHVEGSERTAWVEAAAFDRLTSYPLSMRSTSGQTTQNWVAVPIAPTLLSSRPLRVVVKFVTMRESPGMLEARAGATLPHPLVGLRLQGVVPLGPTVGEPRQDFGGMGWGVAFDLPTASPKPKATPITPPTQLLLLELTPSWAAKATEMVALDDVGSTLTTLQSGSVSKVRYLQVSDQGGKPATIKLLLPDQLARIEFDLAGVPGLPQLAGNDLLDQRIEAIEFHEFMELESVIEAYGQVMLSRPCYTPDLAHALSYQNVSLGELLLDMDVAYRVGDLPMTWRAHAEPAHYEAQDIAPPLRKRLSAWWDDLMRRLPFLP